MLRPPGTTGKNRRISPAGPKSVGSASRPRGRTRIPARCTRTRAPSPVRCTARPRLSPACVAAGGNSPGAILAPGIDSPSQNNPTGTAATATSVNQLIANGTYLPTTPGAVAGAFDVSPYQTLLLEQELESFLASVKSKVFDGRAELFGDLILSESRSFTQWLPVPATGLTVHPNAPHNPLTTNFSGVTFDDLALPKQFFNNTKAIRATVGARGGLGRDWTWETGFVFSQSDLAQRQAHLLYKPNIARAIAGGFDANGNPVAGGAYSQF